MNWSELYYYLISRQWKAILAAVFVYVAATYSAEYVANLLSQAGYPLPLELVAGLMALIGGMGVWLKGNDGPSIKW